MKKLRILVTLILSILAGYWLQPANTAAQATNRAALVVRAGDQSVQTACVEFSEPQISGLDLLLRSDLQVDIEAQGLGALVCRIDNTGCDVNDCWCQCKGGGDCIYWSYWNQVGGNWQYSQIGASMYQVADGAVQGWSWGPGAVNAAIAPPVVTFDEVCNDGSGPETQVTPGVAIVVSPPPTAVPAEPTLQATATAPPATVTPRPSPTAPPTATIAPTATPLPSPIPPTVTVPPQADAAEQSRPTAGPEEQVPATAVVAVEPTSDPVATAAPSPVSMPSPTAMVVAAVEAATPADMIGTLSTAARPEAERSKIAAAPLPTAVEQRIVIGAGVTLPKAQLSPPAAAEPVATTPLAYLVFFILLAFLSGLWVYAQRRSKVR